ncbi:Helix-turn-helix domain-containing protein [Salegentibacter echinorum]|uniref:Helix-turn-helix domain-containing protein n=1 Tax=Salegentibacter echinorum TaxID=1073325 RepID=A0A1M5KYX5_SALEC|nr:helix-turn-helix domain-containing protein [Salegentibacter echinorum]SHG57915.1 Helix-turn-helix domain-containing protein [Salegentibacter echinorum]
MNKAIQFLSTSPEQLAELINEGVKTQLEAFKKELHNKEAQDNLLTREQTANLLQIHETTLWHWTNKGRVTAYSISGKRYYKRSEILESLTELKK